MPYAEMTFKGQKVFVEVDDNGAPVVDGGRAKMKYKLADDREYRPSLANLVPLGGELIAAPTSVARPASQRSGVTQAGPRTTSEDAIIAFTDGACSGNPGPAGLGVLVTFPGGHCVQRGEPLGQGTNNIAELSAILRAVEIAASDGRDIIIHTDSAYSIGVLTAGWKAKANQELIARIKAAIGAYGPGRVTLKKVAGHAGVPENELVDRLARTAGETQRVIEE